MVAEADVLKIIRSLLAKQSDVADDAEKRAEIFIQPLFETLGWDWFSREVKPQKRIRSGVRQTRVDFAFRRMGEPRTAFYLEVKRFSNTLDNPKDIEQALEYGKNGGIRWVVLTNFSRWRIFNSDFYDEPEHAELFEFALADCLEGRKAIEKLLLFARDTPFEALNDYAKEAKKWKKSESVEDLLTEDLIETRNTLTKAINQQNSMLFDTSGQSEDVSLDACVQHILDRIIFCRMLEDNGTDSELRLESVFEAWKADERVQFYRDFLCPFWERMRKVYDSTIFDAHRIDGLSITNDTFVPILKKFYENKKTKLRYRFEAISTDILGHAYENYLSYRVKQTTKRVGIVPELSKRKEGGIYYTPEFLVDHLVTATLGEKLDCCSTPEETLKIRVLDPTCGSGTFLVRALEEFQHWFVSHQRKNGGDDLEKFIFDVLENCIYGIDKDPRAVRLAMLNLFLRAASSPKRLPRVRILERDSLLQETIDGARIFVFSRDLPLIQQQGGFDVLLGNPPWEKWKPNSQEFFEEFDPGFRELPTQKAKKRIEELTKGSREIRYQWDQKQHLYEVCSESFHKTYQHQSAAGTASGDPDLYKLFTERFYQLLKPGGIAGMVVPSGIYTDLGAKGLRALLFDQCKLTGLWSFENRGHAIFPDVHASYKPVLLTFQKGGKTESFPCAFFLHTADDLKRAITNPTVLAVEFVKRSSPTAWSVLEIKTPKDKVIVEKMLKHPPLGEVIAGSWNITLGNGFHMTNDSHLFKTNTLLGIPMLEGKNIEQFTHRFKDHPVPLYKIFEKDVIANLKPEKLYHTGYWLGFRDIASSTNYRTLLTTIVPPGYVCGNTINFVYKLPLKVLAYLCGVLNSFVVDYFIRQKVSAHVNQFYFKEIPLPRLSSGKEFDAIARLSVQLIATTNEFTELKKETGVEHPVTADSDRLQVRAELDALVAKLYGITKEELTHILTQFPLVKGRDSQVDQRQKDLVLAAY